MDPHRTHHVYLDLERLAQRQIVTSDGGRTTVAEDFRAIKRQLLHAARSGAIANGNLVVVTSALQGEGRTYCAVNLAMSMAMEKDSTVMLIDADVARPTLPEVLGLPPAPGLMDVLLGEQADLADVILKTNIPTLSVVPAGRSHKHATEWLASRAMGRLLADIAGRYADRIVIFDSPPLLLTTEASALAAHMGQVVVVVEAGRTTQHAVRQALQHLQHCPNVSLVYNKCRASADAGRYG